MFVEGGQPESGRMLAKQSDQTPGAVLNPKNPSVLEISPLDWAEERRASPDCVSVRLKCKTPFAVVDSSPWWSGGCCNCGLSVTGSILNEGMATGILRR